MISKRPYLPLGKDPTSTIRQAYTGRQILPDYANRVISLVNTKGMIAADPVLLSKLAGGNQVTKILGDGKVKLILQQGPVPSIDTSLTALELRNQEGVDNLLGVVDPELQCDLQTASEMGDINFINTWTLYHIIFIARDMLPESSRAFQLILEHENRHVTYNFEELLDKADRVFGSLIDLLAMSVASPELRSSARSEISACMERADTLLTDTMTAWDFEDYPRLHRSLNELGIELP